MRLTLDDWVRRLDLGRWPYAVLGSARGSVYVADLDSGRVIASADSVHSQIGGNPNGNAYLFGNYDGGGTLAVAMRGDTVVSAGREGGAAIWRIDWEGGMLVGPVRPRGVDGVVTSLEIDEEGRLWVAEYGGTFEGAVYGFDLLDSAPLSEQTPLEARFASGPLCMDVSDDIGVVAVGTAGGTVELISVEDGSIVGSWDVCGSNVGPKTHIRAVEIFHAGLIDEDESKNDRWCVVCGGGDGTMQMRWLRIREGGHLDASDPFDDERQGVSLPRHSGMVVSLQGCRGPASGVLVSGAQDGTLRVWDFADDHKTDIVSKVDAGSVDGSGSGDINIHPIVLYQLAGYKVWLGSVCVDEKGLRLVSDGADNSVVVHDFSKLPELPND